MGHRGFRLIVSHLLYFLEEPRITELNHMDTKEKTEKLKNAQINRALGVFILFFGLVVIVAMVFTDTRVQMITDLIAGLVLSAIGGGMILKSRWTIKSLS